MGNVRLSYADAPQLSYNYTFDTSYGGFVPKGQSGATYSRELQDGALVVKAKEAFGGVTKTITSNAIAGDRYEIKLVVDRGTTDVVRLFMAEGGDPNTPEWEAYAIQYLQPGEQTFEFIYTVTETGSLSIQLDKTDASALQNTLTNFKLLTLRSRVQLPSSLRYIYSRKSTV